MCYSLINTKRINICNKNFEFINFSECVINILGRISDLCDDRVNKQSAMCYSGHMLCVTSIQLFVSLTFNICHTADCFDTWWKPFLNNKPRKMWRYLYKHVPHNMGGQNKFIDRCTCGRSFLYETMIYWKLFLKNLIVIRARLELQNNLF